MGTNGGQTERLVSKLATYLGYGGVAAMALAMLLTTVDATLRYFFAAGIPGSYHLSEFLLVAIVALPLAICQINRAHIRVDLLVSRIPVKTFMIIELVTMSFALFLFALATYSTGQDAIRAFVMGDYEIGIIDYPKWPARSFIPIGTGCLCLSLLIGIITGIRKL